MDPSAFQREHADDGSSAPAEIVRPFLLGSTGKMVLLAGMGAIGGGFLAKVALEHMFSKGLTSDERKNLLGFGGISALLIASRVFFKIDESTISGRSILQKGVETVADTTRSR